MKYVPIKSCTSKYSISLIEMDFLNKKTSILWMFSFLSYMGITEQIIIIISLKLISSITIILFLCKSINNEFNYQTSIEFKINFFNNYNGKKSAQHFIPINRI